VELCLDDAAFSTAFFNISEYQQQRPKSLLAFITTTAALQKLMTNHMTDHKKLLTANITTIIKGQFSICEST